MAEKEPMIVIKKITVVAGGGHGGAWKVAFADFMTAMMAFFLVMWLVNQTDEVKQNVSDYFSTPSIIEYNFSNYGVELTLEKLFLDLMNEPLQFFETFIKPVDKTPNIMAMGTEKIVMHHMADKLGDMAKNVKVYEDEITFDMPDYELFKPGTAVPTVKFIQIMDNVKGLTQGLEDSNVFIESEVKHLSSSRTDMQNAKNIAQARLDIVSHKVELGFENETVDIYGKTTVIQYVPGRSPEKHGFIRFKVKQKAKKADGSKQRKIKSAFGKKDENLDVYENFVNQLTKKKSK